jgi:hypothetical protein
MSKPTGQERVVGALGWILIRLGLGAPALLFVSLVVCGTVYKPDLFCEPFAVDLHLPSEAAIPGAELEDGVSADDILRRFRYWPTGTESRAGVPYWVFRALPRMFPDEFDGQGWAALGFTPDMPGDYKTRNKLPRGMVLVDTRIHLPGFKVDLKLKRVGINCAGCHQGEYLTKEGKRVVVDGMPNHSLDLHRYKQTVSRLFSHPSFNDENLIAAIDEILLEEGAEPLNGKERLFYKALTAYLRTVREEPWMMARPLAGPGRVDAFNAVKFQVIKADDDGTVATVSLPPIWNQGEMRPWHHADGDTADMQARNYGTIIGVGGGAMSVRTTNVDMIGKWIDEDLKPPKWPFGAIDQELADKGKLLFGEKCADCHGLYDRESNRIVQRGNKYMTRINVGTDPQRVSAFSAPVANALNNYGARRGVWASDAFRPATDGYLVAPLDGIWARAPYLHTGAVPTLAHLLSQKEARPNSFYTGNRRYDEERMGWEFEADRDEGRRLFLFNTSLKGNSNAGHEFYVDDEDLPAMLEYLKTL